MYFALYFLFFALLGQEPFPALHTWAKARWPVTISDRYHYSPTHTYTQTLVIYIYILWIAHLNLLCLSVVPLLLILCFFSIFFVFVLHQQRTEPSLNQNPNRSVVIRALAPPSNAQLICVARRRVACNSTRSRLRCALPWVWSLCLLRAATKHIPLYICLYVHIYVCSICLCLASCRISALWLWLLTNPSIVRSHVAVVFGTMYNSLFVVLFAPINEFWVCFVCWRHVLSSGSIWYLCSYICVSVWLPDPFTTLDLRRSVVVPQVHEINVWTLEHAFESLEVKFLFTQLFRVTNRVESGIFCIFRIYVLLKTFILQNF